MTSQNIMTADVTRDQVEALSAPLNEPAWARDLRLAAWEVYAATPMPKLTDEDWRRTDIGGLKLDQFSRDGAGAAAVDHTRLVPGELLTELADAESGGLLVNYQSRRVHCALNDELIRQGVIFTDMVTAVREHGDLVRKYFMTAVTPGAGKFAALHGALWSGGTFVYVPRGVRAALPLHSILWADRAGTSTSAHTLVVLAEGAQATVIHEAAGPAEKLPGLHVGATELFLEDDARLQFVSLQSWGQGWWNFTHERARIGHSANLDWIAGETGSRLTKSYMTIDLDREGATARMSGFFFTDGTQHLDLDTQQNHNAPHTTSDLLFKGALKDRSRTVWQGMIRVEPGAQRTDGYQANRNLVLSKKARADSIPGLEIMADDVRCTHGATVGQIDEDHVYYLLSRGIPRDDAVRLIVDGFFVDIMDRIPFEGLRERLQRAILAKLK